MRIKDLLTTEPHRYHSPSSPTIRPEVVWHHYIRPSYSIIGSLLYSYCEYISFRPHHILSHQNTSEHGTGKSNITSTGPNGHVPIPRPVRRQRSRRRSLRGRSCRSASALLLAPGATDLQSIDLLKVSFGLSISTSSGRRPVRPVFSGCPLALDRAISRLAVVLRDHVPRRGTPVGSVRHVQCRMEAREVSGEWARWIDSNYHVSLLLPCFGTAV